MLLLNKNIFLNIGFYTLFLGIFMGSGIYLLHTALIPVRLGIIVSLFVLFILLFLNKIKEFKINIYFKILILLFIFQFFINLAVTIISLNIDFTKFIQYIVLYFLIFTLIIYASIDRKRYLKSLYYSSLIFMFILIIVTYWEITTSNHFSFSKTYELPEIYSYMPTAFYTNQNDMMAIIVFIIIYNLTYIKYNNLKHDLVHKLIFFVQYIMAIVLSFITESRLATLLLFLFMFINLRLINKLFLLLILTIVILSNDDLYNYLELFFIQPGGNSDGIRINLILDALNNISIFGYGIDNSDLLYVSLNNPKLMGIINPHNYLIEILINSGYIVFLLSIAISTTFIFILTYHKKIILASLIIFYYLILLASSSSIFLYFHYIFLIGFLLLGIDKLKEVKPKYIQKLK